MSRVLRRPMFRGGYVDSEGTGITSGLTEPRQGYANGPTIEGVQPSFLQNIYDILNPSTQTIVERLQANQQQAPVVEEGSVLQSIYDAINPSKETIVKRLQERQLAQREPIIKTQSYREEEKRIAKIMEDKERVERLKREEEEKLKAGTKGTGIDTGAVTGTMEQPTKTDLRTVYEDLLPLFQKELGVAEDEFSRQKYLELAKFGLNLLRQPGGPAGGKRDLLGAIAASAEKPLEGYQTILAKEKQAQRLPKALALEAAMKEAEPGSIGKAVKDLKKLGISENKAIEMATQSGTATREQTFESVIRNIQEGLVKNGIVTDDYAARTTAQELLIAERQGVPSALFEKFPANPIEGNYYIMKNGQSGRYYQGKLLKPGEKGFTGPLSK
jgi:hypothetical protein